LSSSSTRVGEALEGYQELFLGVISGLVQGVFEWIPVSSKTILLLIFYWVGFSPSMAYLLGLFLNGSTAAAAIIYFRKDVLKMLRGLRSRGEGRSLLIFLTLSTLTTGVTAIPLAGLVAGGLELLNKVSMLIIGFLYVLMSVLLWVRERMTVKAGSVGFSPFKDGVLAGLAQGFSALPGVSRSGVTILALLALGHHPLTALRLSFLMSIPATLGGTIYVALIHEQALVTASPLILASSSITAITSSVLMIALLLKASEKLKPHFLTLILALITILTALTQSL